MTLMESIKELGEATNAHMAAIKELEQVMLARGFITKESLERARQEMEDEPR